MKNLIEFVKENTFKIIIVFLLCVSIYYQAKILDEVDSVYIQGGSVSIDDYSPIKVRVENEVDVTHSALEKLEDQISSYSGLKVHQ
jgi:hypothetical protein